MWTKDHKRSDANHIAWINLIQCNAIDCAKLGLMCVQKWYIDASSAQVTVPGLNGGFFFRGLKKLKWGDSWIHSTAQRKEHSKTEFDKKYPEIEFGESETFYWSKFSRATGVKKYIPLSLFCFLKELLGNLQKQKTLFPLLVPRTTTWTAPPDPLTRSIPPKNWVRVEWERTNDQFWIKTLKPYSQRTNEIVTGGPESGTTEWTFLASRVVFWFQDIW